jgi:hypothetical protein
MDPNFESGPPQFDPEIVGTVQRTAVLFRLKFEWSRWVCMAEPAFDLFPLAING